jgi:hypothetical protein
VALYEAIRDSRIEDVLALVDPDVTCKPLVRPGLSAYHGQDGMADLIRDMHAVHGRYQVEIAEITEQDGPEVTVRAVIVPEPGRGDPLPVTSVYTFRGSLITSIESGPTASGGPLPGGPGQARCGLSGGYLPDWDAPGPGPAIEPVERGAVPFPAWRVNNPI